MKHFAIATTTLSFALALPTAAFAYVGPGAGLSLLGALWALIVALGVAVAFVVAWPVRKMLRRKRADNPSATAQRQAPDTGTSVSPPQESRGA